MLLDGIMKPNHTVQTKLKASSSAGHGERFLSPLKNVPVLACQKS